MKILIAVPTFETIQPEVFKAIYDIKKGEHEVDFDFVKGYDCAIARNEIGKLVQARHYDYVLMVDSDTLVPPDVLDIMLEDPVDVCLGVCPRKNTKDGKTAIVKLGSESYHDNYYYSDLPTEKTKIKGGGFACAMIKAYVFTQLDYPWFQYVTNEDWSTLSEDYYFCMLCGLFGVDIYVEPKVKCGHLARYYQYE